MRTGAAADLVEAAAVLLFATACLLCSAAGGAGAAAGAGAGNVALLCVTGGASDCVRRCEPKLLRSVATWELARCDCGT